MKGIKEQIMNDSEQKVNRMINDKTSEMGELNIAIFNVYEANMKSRPH